MGSCRFQEDPVGASAMRPRRRGEHMIKQTYSVYVHTPDGMKKWHLSSSGFAFKASIESAHEFLDAYWTQETLDRLLTVDDIPELRSLEVAPGTYLCARTNRMREAVSRSARNLFSEGIALQSPSASPTYAPYPYQRHPADERPSPAPLSPSSSVSSHAGNGMRTTTSPRLYATQSQGLSLAPLEMLEECRRRRRDASDEGILRSFN
jgi:hypothetical protein